MITFLFLDTMLRLSVSIGKGNTIVELCSVDIALSVCNKGVNANDNNNANANDNDNDNHIADCPAMSFVFLCCHINIRINIRYTNQLSWAIN